MAIISDRDKIYTSGFWTSLFKKLGTSTNLSTAYHPQSDGQSERLNQCVEMYLRCFTYQQPRLWSKLLPMVEWWHNTSHHSAINMTPYLALYGRKPPSINYHRAGHSNNPCVDTFLQQRVEIQKLLKATLLKAHARMKFYADKRRT